MARYSGIPLCMLTKHHGLVFLAVTFPPRVKFLIDQCLLITAIVGLGTYAGWEV